MSFENIVFAYLVSLNGNVIRDSNKVYIDNLGCVNRVRYY